MAHERLIDKDLQPTDEAMIDVIGPSLAGAWTELRRFLVETYEIGWWAMLIGIQVVWFLLGCVIDAWSILMITLPILLPILPLYGFDPLWLGVLYAVNTQTGYLTPPFGTMLFLIKGIAPKEVTMNDIYRSIVPFVVTQLVCLALCIIFPKIVTWLPNLLFN